MYELLCLEKISPLLYWQYRTGRRAPKHPGGFQWCHTRFSSALEMQDVGTVKNNAIWTWPAWLQYWSLIFFNFSNTFLTKSVNLRQCSFCAREMLILQKWAWTGLPAGFSKMIHRYTYQVWEHNSLFTRETTSKWKKQQKQLQKEGLLSYFHLYFQRNSLHNIVQFRWLQENLMLMGRWQQQEIWPSGEYIHIPEVIT